MKIYSGRISYGAKTKEIKKEAVNLPRIKGISRNYIDIETLEGFEYSINDGNDWQDNGRFENLKPDKVYTGLVRNIEGTAGFRLKAQGCKHRCQRDFGNYRIYRFFRIGKLKNIKKDLHYSALSCIIPLAVTLIA